MDREISPQHPLLELGSLHIPGPAIPIILLGFPFIMPPGARRHLLHRSSFKEWLGNSLAITHMLLYIHKVWGVLKGKENMHNNTLLLLEYLSLVLGEAALEESNFWLYTSVALGWSLSIPPSSSPSQISALPYLRAMILLILSMPSTLVMSDQLSNGATLSALSLLTRATFWASTSSITGHGFWATTLARIVLPLLAKPCYTEFVRTARGQPWSSRVVRALQSWLGRVQHNSIGQYMNCTQIAVAAQTLSIAGLILSSFVWSCFRWRWLFAGHASRAPSWTAS